MVYDPDRSHRPSGTSQPETPRETAQERAEKTRMLSKLCSMFTLAANEDAELKIAALREELRDVPSIVLSHALSRIVRRKVDFLPTLAEIRKECALFLRERHRIAMGLDPNWMLPSGEINVERWLERAREPLPALPSGREQEEFATPEQRAAGARLLDQLVARKEVR